MLTNDAAATMPKRENNTKEGQESPPSETPSTKIEIGDSPEKEKGRGRDRAKDRRYEDDKRFTFSKSNGGISHRKSKDTQTSKPHSHNEILDKQDKRTEGASRLRTTNKRILFSKKIGPTSIWLKVIRGFFVTKKKKGWQNKGSWLVF